MINMVGYGDSVTLCCVCVEALTAGGVEEDLS